jgi:antitoxin PrlF
MGEPMITSRLTSKAQTTIPQAVRTALHLGEGDTLAYAIEGDRVVLTKAKSAKAEDPFATFGEWATEADERAYADL